MDIFVNKNFTMDCLLEANLGPYPGLSKGQSWNGWEVPYFSPEVTKQILNDMHEAGMCIYTITNDHIEVCMNEGLGVFSEPDYFSSIPGPGGEGIMYSLGGMSWVWEDADYTWEEVK